MLSWNYKFPGKEFLKTQSQLGQGCSNYCDKKQMLLGFFDFFDCGKMYLTSNVPNLKFTIFYYTIQWLYVH